MPTEDKTIGKISELQKYLNCIAIIGNLHNEKVLETSRELDILITKYYLEREKEQKNNI